MLQRQSKTRLQIKDRRRIIFYPAVFDEPTRITEENNEGNLVTYTEVIKPGAFLDALKSDQEVIANLDHDNTRAFAKRSDGSLLLQEDPHGLFASAWIPEGQFGDAILRDVESGKLDGCSFKFLPVGTTRNREGHVERRSVMLADVCLTGSPAYPGTEVHLRSKQNLRTRYLFTKLKLMKLRLYTGN